MELLYFWVGRKNSLYNFGINFSSEFDISFDNEQSIISFKRKSKANVNLFDNTFINITALIGKNGTGKTSILSVIMDFFSEDPYALDKKLIVIKNNDGEIQILKKNMIEEFEIKKEELVDNNIAFINTDENLSSRDLIQLIIYSGVFLYSNNRKFSSNYIDLSFDMIFDFYSKHSNEQIIEKYELLLEFKKKKEINETKFQEDRKIFIEHITPKAFIKKSKNIQVLKFISEYHKDPMWSFLPPYIGLRFNSDFFDKSIIELEKAGLSNIVKYNTLRFRDVFDIVNKPFEKETIYWKYFKRQIYVYFLFYSIKNERFNLIPNTSTEEVIKRLNAENNFEKLELLIIEKLSLFSRVHKSQPIAKIGEIINNMETMFCFSDYFEATHESFYFRISDKLLDTLNTIFTFWENDDSIFDIQWEERSSGENAFILLFSKFNEIKKKIFGDTIWLIIDEWEVYLHPEWQRSFFYNLHKYLPLFFKNKKIQLFLTSHSPFLVSDLPIDNIIMLDKKDGKTEIANKEKMGNTLGANIHSLLSDSFFMENGHIGEFAKKIIFELVDEIKNISDYTPEMLNTLEKKIEMIGEPIIKNKLREQLLQKLNNSQLLQQKRSLEKKLETINNLIKKQSYEKD